MCAGKASINHCFRGMELMTTFGTWYVLCRTLSDCPRDVMSASGIPVSVLDGD